MTLVDETLDELVAFIGAEPARRLLSLGVLTVEGQNAMVRAIDRAKEAEAKAGAQLDLTLSDTPTLQAEVDAGRIMLHVYACPDCGTRIAEQKVKNRSWPPRCFECNGLDEQEQTLMDGKAMVATEIPVRKLPDAFKHLDGISKRAGITEKYLAKLSRLIDQQRQGVVPVRDVGFAHNARLILRFAAGRAGVNFEAGAVRVFGEDEGARVHFFVDPEEGMGAPIPDPDPPLRAPSPEQRRSVVEGLRRA